RGGPPRVAAEPAAEGGLGLLAVRPRTTVRSPRSREGFSACASAGPGLHRHLAPAEPAEDEVVVVAVELRGDGEEGECAQAAGNEQGEEGAAEAALVESDGAEEEPCDEEHLGHDDAGDDGGAYGAAEQAALESLDPGVEEPDE